MLDALLFTFFGTLFIFCIFFILFFIVKTNRKQTWKEFFEAESRLSRQSHCKHEKWNYDPKMKTIECKNCGLKGCIED